MRGSTAQRPLQNLDLGVGDDSVWIGHAPAVDGAGLAKQHVADAGDALLIGPWLGWVDGDGVEQGVERLFSAVLVWGHVGWGVGMGG